MDTIEELKNQRDELDAKIKAIENGRWKPERGDGYHSLSNYLYKYHNLTWTNDKFDQFYYDIGEVFRTAEERDAYVNRLKAVTKYNDYIRSTGFVADWGDDKQDKYYANYYHDKKTWWCLKTAWYSNHGLFMPVTDILPAASIGDVLAAIASLGEDERWLR